jgi:hypothetical protein
MSSVILLNALLFFSYISYLISGLSKYTAPKNNGVDRLAEGIGVTLPKIKALSRFLIGTIIAWASLGLLSLIPPGMSFANTLGSLFLLLMCISLEKFLQNCSKEGLSKTSVAVIEVDYSKNRQLQLWLRKTGEVWPPIKIDIGINNWVIPVKDVDDNVINDIRNILSKTSALNNEELEKDLKKVLKENEATHVIDIEGATIIPEVESFFERVFSKPNTAIQNA